MLFSLEPYFLFIEQTKMSKGFDILKANVTIESVKYFLHFIKGGIKMDWVKLVYLGILLICGIFILVTSFSKKNDERRKFINAKAQSYAFVIVVGALLLHVVESMFYTFQGTKTDTHIVTLSPVIFLSLVSIVYVITLLVYRNKYGN